MTCLASREYKKYPKQQEEAAAQRTRTGSLPLIAARLSPHRRIRIIPLIVINRQPREPFSVVQENLRLLLGVLLLLKIPSPRQDDEASPDEMSELRKAQKSKEFLTIYLSGDHFFLDLFFTSWIAKSRFVVTTSTQVHKVLAKYYYLTLRPRVDITKRMVGWTWREKLTSRSSSSSAWAFSSASSWALLLSSW